MIYSALVKDINQEIEGEVTLQVNGFEMVCFSNMPPAMDAIGTVRPIELMPMVFGEYEVKEISALSTPAVERIGDSFSYLVSGKLSAGKVDAGVVSFEDDMLNSEFGYLDGKMITWKIERLDVDFQ